MYDTSKTKILKAAIVLKYKKFTQLNIYNRESNYFALFFIEKTIVNFIVLSIKNFSAIISSGNLAIKYFRRSNEGQNKGITE